MAESIVSTVLEQLKEITIDKAREAWNLVRGAEKEVKRLESNFEALRLELEDAEEREYQDKRVKLWLDKFRDVAYDMEDVLGEWEAAIQQLQRDGVESSSSSSVRKWIVFSFLSCFSRVCPFLSCFSSGSQIVRRYDIATKIKEINEELDQIVNDKVRLELIKKENKQHKRRLESTSFVDVSELIGRDAVKEDLISTLLCDERIPNIHAIAILGIGGIGKTAIAQLIYNDSRIQKHFNKTIWVFASDPFDRLQIARTILADLDPGTLAALHAPTLQNVLVKIIEKLQETKFLFVFDDMWTIGDQDWEPLETAFKCGRPGSCILVTTRNESVARQVKSSQVVHLELLHEKMCWSILAQKALSGRNGMSGENLEDIGREIAKKCGGLPVAAKTLGGLLQNKRTREEWLHVLNSAIWKSGVGQEIFSPLLLSYYDLPWQIRQCLSYCAIFTDNYAINRDELIRHWMAQGYLNCDDVRRESKGKEYFEYLASRSFFQNFREYDHGSIISCKMHDLVYAFVQFLTEHRFVTEVVVENSTLDLSSKKARHLRLTIPNCESSPLCIYGIEKLRSLVVYSDDRTSGDALQDLFSRSKLLRLLELDSFHLCDEEIVRGMENLIHLRYLSLISCSGLTKLPEAVCELINLQSLNLQDCLDLRELAVGIGKLINLSYLRIKDCPCLTYYPKGISNLTSLETLSDIKMRIDRNDGDQLSIGDLEHLDLLGGNLCVVLIGDAIDWKEAKRAKLHKKIHLKRMKICISSKNIKKEEVLQALNPPSNLLVDVPSDYHNVFDRYKTKIKKLIRGQIRRGWHYDAISIREKIRVALIVQKATRQFLDQHGPSTSQSDEDPTD